MRMGLRLDCLDWDVQDETTYRQGSLKADTVLAWGFRRQIRKLNALKSIVNSQFLIVTLTFCFSVWPSCTQVCWTNQQDGLAGTSLTETSGSLQIPQERWTWSQREMKTEGHTIDSPALVCSQPVSSAFFFDCSSADITFTDVSISKEGPFAWMTTLKPHTCHYCKNPALLYRIQRKCKKKNYILWHLNSSFSPLLLSIISPLSALCQAFTSAIFLPFLWTLWHYPPRKFTNVLSEI